MMNRDRFEHIMSKYADRYKNMLDVIWPSMGSNGFVERNQTANFVAAYEATMDEEAVYSWQEFQITNESSKIRNNHIDGLIVNADTKELFLIEAKRFSKGNVKKKKQELVADFRRIMDLNIDERLKELFLDKSLASKFRVFGCLLYDLWDETKVQKRLLEWYRNVQNVTSLGELRQRLTENCDCVKKDIPEENEVCFLYRNVNAGDWKKNEGEEVVGNSYHLGCMIWDIKAASEN